MSKLTNVCLFRPAANKLVGNKSSSLPHLHLFKAKGGRVIRPVQSLYQICNSLNVAVFLHDLPFWYYEGRK